jgi:hypothetical protein
MLRDWLTPGRDVAERQMKDHDPRVSSTDYRKGRRGPGNPSDPTGLEPDDATVPGRPALPRLAQVSSLPSELQDHAHDLAVTRARTAPMTPDLIAAALAADPEPVPSRTATTSPLSPTPALGTPALLRRPRSSASPPGRSLVLGGVAIDLLVDGDRVTLTVPGAPPISARRDELMAFGVALSTAARRDP